MKTLINEADVQKAVTQVAEQINTRHANRPLTIIAVMTGSIILLADLIRQLRMPLRVGVVQASSYRGTERGKLSINAEMMPDIGGRDVILVDDIFDTGHTMAEVMRHMKELGPTSIETAVLLLKEGRQLVDYRPDYVAFEIPDEFVVGYGLDYEDEFRNLNYIAALEPHDIRK